MRVPSSLRAPAVVGLMLSLLGAAALRAAAVAAAPIPLPPFAVVTLAGERTESAALSVDGRWLLLYVDGTSQPSREILQMVSNPPVNTAIAPRLVIVVGRATGAEAEALRGRFPALHAARWFADSQNEAFRAIRAPGAPVMLRMKGGEEHGRVLGLLPDRGVMLSLLQSWVAQ